MITNSAQGQSGFTLIEIMLAMAISSGLAVIAIAGQHQLQSRARFDAAVDKFVADVAYTKNYAASNVNLSGGGNAQTRVVLGATLVTSGTAATLVPFYGDAASNVPTGPADASQPDGRQRFGFATPLTFASGTSGSQLIGFKNDGRSTVACLQTLAQVNATDQLCAPGNAQDSSTLSITLGDSDGHAAHVQVEPKTGTARRVD